MSKKVLVISGSPRKGGNSDLLCDQFIKGASEAGHAAEKVYLRDSKIGFCMACYACRDTKKCVQNDDGDAIVEKMMQADVIVMATPVYFWAMAGQMKTMIDRTLPHWTDIAGKDFYIIVSAAETSHAAMQRTVEEFRGFIECMTDGTEKGVIYGTGAYAIGDIQGSPAMEDAYNAGKAV